MHSNNDPRDWRVTSSLGAIYIIDEDGNDVAPALDFPTWQAAKDWLDQAIRDDLAAQAQESET